MFRTRRSSHSDEPASILRLVESLDKSQCVKQLVCQIYAKEAAARSQEENLIIALVGKQVDNNNDNDDDDDDDNDDNDKQPGVAASKLPMVEFEMAAKIGASSGSGEACQALGNIL